MNPTLVVYERLQALLEADPTLSARRQGNRVYLTQRTGAARADTRTMPADKASYVLDIDQSTTAASPPRTFGQRDGGAEVMDYGVPVSPGFRITVSAESPTIEAVLTVEGAIERAILKPGRALGIPWVEGPSPIRWQRNRILNRWTSIGTFAVNGRPKLSLLTS